MILISTDIATIPTMSDDRIDFIGTIPDEGCRLRRKLCEQQDIHSVRSHDGRHVTEVRTIYDTAAVPIYAPCQGFDQSIRFLIEGLLRRCGSLPPILIRQRQQRHRRLFARGRRGDRLLDMAGVTLNPRTPRITRR